MKRHLIALCGALAVLLGIGTGVAQAQGVQGVEQAAVTGQSASSNASSTQVAPTNSNIDVRIFSPGDNGSVTQSNSSAAASAALNAAQTSQAAAQSQAGGGGDAVQAVGQGALTGQQADSSATSEQVKPTNSNIAVRIHSPGDNGDVSQSNSSEAASLAGNLAKTDQIAAQKQGGGGGGKCCSGSGSGVQAVGQEAATLQKAHSDATSKQIHPTNTNIPVRLGSEGDNGSVSQSNSSAAKSIAGNLAFTGQAVRQDQGGGGGCGCSGDLVQAVGQKALTGQAADSKATSFQKGATNTNAPLRIFSKGDNGDVDQSNDSAAFSAAFNAAGTFQAVGQSQGGRGCGCGGMGDDGKSGGGGDYGAKEKGGGYDGKDHGGGARVQAVGQFAATLQHADSNATSAQLWPTNKNVPVRIKSYGDNGDVSQSNSSFAASLALNLAKTAQLVRQDQ